MTSATLYREGDDLDALLAELDAEHPGQVRVIEVSYPRTGGIAGFFAKQKVGVEYILLAGAVSAGRPRPKPARRPSPAPRPAQYIETRPPQYVEVRGMDGLDEMLEEADARDSRDHVRAATAAGDAAGTSNAEFAQLLLELAAKKSATRAAGPAGPSGPSGLSRLNAQLKPRSARADAAVTDGTVAAPAGGEPVASRQPQAAATPAMNAVIADALAAHDLVEDDPTVTIKDIESSVFEPIATPVLDTVGAVEAVDAAEAAPVIDAVANQVVRAASIRAAASALDAKVALAAAGSIGAENTDTADSVAEDSAVADSVAESAAVENAAVENAEAPVRRRRAAGSRASAPKPATTKSPVKRGATKRTVPADMSGIDAAQPAGRGISVPDLSLRSLTSATAAIVADNAVTPSQIDVLKQLRGKLADVVDLLDQLGETQG